MIEIWEGTHRLQLTSRCHFARANRPNWLVGDDDLLPRVLIHHLVDGVQLPRHDLDRGALLSLLQALSTAKDDPDPVLDRTLGLAGNEAVVLIQYGAALAMPEQCPVDSAVFELHGRDFAGEGARGFVKDVLRGYFELGVEMFAGHKEVEGWWSNNHFGIGIWRYVTV